MAIGLAPTPILWPTAPDWASIETTVLSAALATHNKAPAAAIAVGELPTSIGAPTGRPVAMLILETVRSPLLATHTEPSAMAIPVGARPTGMLRLTTDLLARSIWDTVPSPVFVT